MSVNAFYRAQAQQDFRRARLKSLVTDIWDWVQGRSREMLSYDDVKDQLKLGGVIYRGTKTIKINDIVGSVGRYEDFDRYFFPANDHLSSRWQRVDMAFYDDINLPPIVVYQVGDVYFVVDGNHRVSVAKQQGIDFIDAEIREATCQVPFTKADLDPAKLRTLGAYADFIRRSNVNTLIPHETFETTIADGYKQLVHHIAEHRYFMGIDFQRDITADEAVLHWYETIYAPLIETVEQHAVFEKFPKATQTDLYLWIMDRLHFLKEHQQDTSLEAAVEDYSANPKGETNELVADLYQPLAQLLGQG